MIIDEDDFLPESEMINALRESGVEIRSVMRAFVPVGFAVTENGFRQPYGLEEISIQEAYHKLRKLNHGDYFSS